MHRILLNTGVLSAGFWDAFIQRYGPSKPERSKTRQATLACRTVVVGRDRGNLVNPFMRVTN